jgi:kinesin family protein 2/24
MEQFLLNNASQYQKLVKEFSPLPKKVGTRTSAANIVVSVRIRPLLKDDIAAGFPCAVFPRSTEPGVVDIHDLYNHPRGRPILKVCEVDCLYFSLLATYTNS